MLETTKVAIDLREALRDTLRGKEKLILLQLRKISILDLYRLILYYEYYRTKKRIKAKSY